VAADNLVVIVVDQLSHWATDPAQRAPLDLPNLDALAAQGTTFTRAYATSPVCSENRLALLTGQYPFTLGTNTLHPGVGSMGTMLEAAGWDTGYIGKWHLSPSASPSGFVASADRPGWRYFAGSEGVPHKYVTGFAFKQDDPTPVSTSPWEPTWNTTEAVRFLQAPRSKPFALVVNYGPPHPTVDTNFIPNTFTPKQIILRPNVEDRDKAAAKQRYVKYMSLAVTTDTELGVLLSEIDLATTFVLLTADHGDMLMSHGLGTNQQKRRPWEEAAHIPLILAGPGIAAGVQDSGMMSTVDILPSMFHLLGVTVPAEVEGSPWPYFSPVYFGHDDPDKSWGGERWRGLVDGYCKYAVSESGALETLFDLVSDPYELTNLALNPVYAPTLNSMRAAVQARAHTLGDPFVFPTH